MGNNIFARGYGASREEKARQDLARENAGKKLWRFFLKEDKDEADLRFLTEEPVNFYEHTIKEGSNIYSNYTCTGSKDCPFCEDGDKPTYRGAYLVVDRREFEYEDQNTGKKKKGKDQVRLFVQGMRVVSQLDRISEKYGLSNRDVTIVRLGKGTSTSYTIERGDELKLSHKEIETYLPEKLRGDYDGTMDSLMNIVEEQLLMSTKNYVSDTDDDDSYENSDKIIGVDEEDEVEVKPKKSKLSRKFKPAQNSLKPRTKDLLSGK